MSFIYLQFELGVVSFVFASTMPGDSSPQESDNGFSTNLIDLLLVKPCFSILHFGEQVGYDVLGFGHCRVTH